MASTMMPSHPINLEQWVSKRLCISGGSLDLIALKDAMDHDNVMLEMSLTSLQRFLKESPHKMFRLDEDAKHDKCTVRIKTDAVLCDQFDPKSSNGCQGCYDFHLCQHFISVGCKRGRKCFWPHQLWGVPHNERVMRLNGLDHLQDTHVMQILKLSWPDITVPDVCKFYNTKGCDDANKCRFLHICRHYITGDCKFNTKCRYSHDVKDNQPISVWEEYGINAASMSPGELLRMVREKKQIEPVEVMEKQARLPDICIHYNRRSCKKGDTCPFLHVCRSFVRGECKDECKFSHDLKNPNALKVWQKHEVDARNKTIQELVSMIQGHMDGENKIQRRRLTSLGEAPEEKQDKSEICEYKLRGKCYFDEGCRKVHCEQNFQWQYSDDNQSWTSWKDDVNVAIETVFCDITRKNTGSKASCIDFKTMKWTNSAGVSFVRRLETPVLKPSDSPLCWQTVLSTKWQWYYLDEGPVWVLYAQNMEIERAYQSYKTTGEPKRFKFETASFKYSLNFTSMRQTNLITGTKREARRRPAQLCTKDMLEKCLKKTQVLATILPLSWDTLKQPADPSDNFVLCEVQPDIHKAEYDKVQEHFAATMDKRLIIKIERVQNIEAWDEFVRKRDKMKENHKDHNDAKEELLFHGTRKAFIKAICQQNFDPRVSGSNVGTKYGQGSYFSKTSVYSDCYAEETDKGTKQMFLVRVLVGSYILGNPSYRRPPFKDASNLCGPMFDSCVDSQTNPMIFVTFDSCQVYPEYMITYKRK
ncbi:protein mono-ADP-ribosyltransferase PARP12-like [Asterias amurensis]|uniref:protein mono-ADP-ribosyltransferase PARP12-like n=1 Tax=Asterias amurensis TaxID=7602 RepID=UPI003AB86D95